MPKKEEKSFFSSLGNGLSSLQLAIALLIILAGISIFGTVIPQNAPPEEYLRVYKLTTYKILKILGLLDMYHTRWFYFLLALLSLNLVVCSLKRLRIMLPLFFPARFLEEGQWKAFSFRKRYSAKGLPADCLIHYRETLSRVFGRPRVLESPGGYQLLAEKGKHSRLGVYFIHLSILVILTGALIGSSFGFRGHVNIVEGQVADRVILRNGQETQLPGFNVKLEKFTVAFYPSGAPQEFKSLLTIQEKGRPESTVPVRVNHPLTYKGITFYQSNYGVADVANAVLAIKERGTGNTLTVPALMGVRREIPGGSGAFVLSRFVPDLQGMGPAFEVVFSESNQPPINFWVLPDHPELENRQPLRFQFSVKDFKPIYYSGLQVTKDPGVEVVWIGCFLMVVGFYMAFFLSHRRVWIKLTENPGGTRVEMAGASHRDHAGFKKEFEKMDQAMQELQRKK